jgi:hypothetical protein
MLEYAVRPFTTPNSHGKIVIPSTPGATNQRATITWGSKATNVPVPEQTGDFNVVCCTEHLNEIQREVDIVQIPIQDPEGANPHVTVARSKKVILRTPLHSNPCDSPLDQALGAEYGLDDTGDVTINLGFAGTVKPQEKCGAIWELNNNTSGA